MRQQSMRATVLGVLALAMVAACSSATNNDGEDAAPPESEGSGESEEPEAERVLNVWLYQEPRQFNPLLGKHGPDTQLMSLVYDSLFLVTPDGIRGSLAESWTVSEDATTYTIELVDAEWSDGEAFTAEDVVFSYTLLANPEISAAASNLAGIAGVQDYVDGNTDNIAGLRAEGDSTVVVELAEPNSAWAEQMAGFHYILPEHVLGDVPIDGILDHGFFNEPTVALGPFEFVERQEGQHIELAQNESYRDDVQVDRVFMVEGDSDVATAQLETGDFDLAFISPTDVERIEQIDHLVVERAPGIGQIRLGVATDGDLLGDPRVRQAIMHGIDREGIVEQAFGGYGSVHDLPFIGPDWAIPDDLGSYDYDPDRARDLLEEADWDPSATVRLNIIPGTRDRDTTAEIIQGQLGEIGMNVSIEQMEAGPYVEALQERDIDLALYGGGVQHIHPHFEAVTHMCATAQPDGPNNSGYCNERVDELFLAGRATPDSDEQATIYQELSRILFEEVPYIWLYSPEFLWVRSERLQGFEPIGDFGASFWNAAEWSVSDG